jgi:diguanylate cyclase (GGDEF)-like protein
VNRGTHHDGVIGSLRRQPREGRARSLKLWAIVAAFFILIGIVGSFVGALAVSNTANEKNQKVFATSSVEITAALRLSIQHEQDLIESIESFLIGNPDATQAEFTKWSKDVHVLRRFRDVSGLGVFNGVTAAQLPAYARTQAAAQSTPFRLVPAGKRPFYCFASAGLFRTGVDHLAKDYDVCDGPEKSLILDAVYSGKSEVLPYPFHGQQVIGLETPVYRGGANPATVVARKHSFEEIIALLLLPHTFLASALAGHANTSVALRYGGATSGLVFRSGTPSKGAQTTWVNLHDGWTVEILGPALHGGLIHNDDALAVLFSELALTLLLGALVYVLGTGRARSLLLVHERTEELQYQALHDPLTGLPNRALIVDRIEQLLERNRRHGTFAAALYVDLDDFKNVNDTLGHEAGDHLLVLVAERMKSTLRGADTIGRMGGDEFVVLVDGGDQTIAPELVAQRLLNVMRQPFDLDGALMPIIVNTSIGIAVGDRRTPSQFLRDADVALYQAKNAGKNRYAFFNSKMQDDTERRISLEFDLRSALGENQFYLVFQPIYDLRDLTIVGVETLLRWRHPTDGVIGPAEFIPILERTGQIVEVGAWVLSTACRQMAAWHARGYHLDVSVNVSARQLDSDLIIENIRGAVLSSGLDASSLIIEVTETGLMLDVNSAVTRLQTIKDLGVRIAIDDFGTGYCSLSYLRQFPIDCIKIDQSFTSSLATSSESQALVKTFIQLGRDLGLKTLAEGVETVEQMDILRASRVNEVQGFLFSRPLDAAALEEQILEPMQRSAASGPPKVT